MWSARLKTSISLAGSIQGNAWKGGTKRKTCQVLQKLDCEYASGCGKREPCLPLSIRVFEELGLDTVPLLQAREAYRKKQEQRRQEQKEQEEEKRRLEEAKWQQELNEEKQKFLNGEYIPANMFLEITKRDGFEIHIRTKGTLNRHVCGLNKSGSIRFYKKRGCRTPDFSGCHKAIAAYLTFLETITES